MKEEDGRVLAHDLSMRDERRPFDVKIQFGAIDRRRMIPPLCPAPRRLRFSPLKQVWLLPDLGWVDAFMR